MEYFQKSEMSQLIPSASLNNYTPDLYSAYADSFDLSLLSTDDRETTIASSKCQTSLSSSASDNCDYIPSTLFNGSDQSMNFAQNSSMPTIKTEKLWNCDSTSASAAALQNTNNLINNFNINFAAQQQQINGQEDCSASAAASLLFQQLQKQYQFYPSPLPSPPQYEYCNLNSVSSSNNYSLYSPASSTLSPSPCPSLDQQQINNFGSLNSLAQTGQSSNTSLLGSPNFPQVKQEYLILPPSPPESNGSPSPSLNEIKSEPEDNDLEANLIDINILLEKTLQNFEENQKKLQQQQQREQQEAEQRSNQEREQQQEQQLNANNIAANQPPQPQDYQLLREYLQDTSFQKKHNLKPLALESLIGGLGVRSDIEPVISLALEHAKRDAQATCAQLQISPDPQQWTTVQVHAWMQSTIEQFKLQPISELELKFPEDGANLLCLTEDEFVRRLPESGATIHAQLEIWKLAFCDNFPIDIFPAGPSTSATTNSNSNNKNAWLSNASEMDFTDDEDDEMEHQASVTQLDSTNTASSIEMNGQQDTQKPTASSVVAAAATNSNAAETRPAAAAATATATSTSQPIVAATTPASPTAANCNSKTAANTQVTKAPRAGGSHIHLWQFLKELLASPQVHGTAIRWLDRNKGVFKIEDSVRVAKLWGRRKNRPAMNYDKLSRSIRQYYKKGIMKKTERSQRLVYQFCHPYCL